MVNFYLTRRSFIDLQKIYDYTQENWGESKADDYVSELYEAFNKIVNNADIGILRKDRSNPFLMYPSGRHYIVYDLYKGSIIIITILHLVRNIENIVKEFGSTFYNEIESLKAEINSSEK